MRTHILISTILAAAAAISLPLQVLAADEMIVRPVECGNGANSRIVENTIGPDRKGFGNTDKVILASVPIGDGNTRAGVVARVKLPETGGGNFSRVTLNYLFKGLDRDKSILANVQVKAFFKLNLSSPYGPPGTIKDKILTAGAFVNLPPRANEWNVLTLNQHDFEVSRFLPDLQKVIVYLKSGTEKPLEIQFGEIKVNDGSRFPIRATELKMNDAGCHAFNHPNNDD